MKNVPATDNQGWVGVRHNPVGEYVPQLYATKLSFFHDRTEQCLACVVATNKPLSEKERNNFAERLARFSFREDELELELGYFAPPTEKSLVIRIADKPLRRSGEKHNGRHHPRMVADIFEEVRQLICQKLLSCGGVSLLYVNTETVPLRQGVCPPCDFRRPQRFGRESPEIPTGFRG